jgi:hypothetical protein
VDERLEAAKERAWREVAAINAAHERGELDEAGWHAAMADLVVPSYLAAETAEASSGHSGTPTDWAYSRGIVAEAVGDAETFLDRVVAPGGRLVIGKFNEEVGRTKLEGEVAGWGYPIGGRVERAHRSEPRLAYRVFWIDCP